MATSKLQVLAISGKGVFGKVTNYSALPNPTLHDGETWIALTSQGSSFWPGSLGGTFYDKGQYYSNGTDWTYDSTPYQASQSDVNAGIIEDEFVSPVTLANSSFAFYTYKVLATGLVGLNTSLTGTISSSDSILTAFGRIQNSLSAITSDVSNKQPLDSDLTTIAAINANTSNGVLASDGSGWIYKTYSALKTAMSFVKGDVGLGNVDNTSDVDKPVSAAQATADALVLSTTETYADGKVIDSIADSDTTHAPSRNAVFDALALKASTTYVDSQDTTTLNAAKAYTDSQLASLASKPDVAYASTSALPANTYNNGSSGVGATLTGNVNGPLLIDSVTILVGQIGQRVLVAGESTSANNGWYTITQQGVVAISPYILTRATESDQAVEIGAGYLTGIVAPNTVIPGSSNNGKLFISVANDPFTVGTTGLTFSQVGSTYLAGTGLTLSGQTFSVTTPLTDTNIATIHHAANTKTSLVDTDEVTGGDSAASFGLIRITWTNVKVFLKTYFDGIYQAILSIASSAEINTGTDNAKYTTASGLQGSKYLSQYQGKIYAIATGTDTYVATFSPVFTTLSAGITINVLFNNANTGAVTINIDGLGAKAITKDNITALGVGDIKTGVIYSMTYDGTRFQCDCGEMLNSDNLSGLISYITSKNNLKLWNLSITGGNQTTTSTTAGDITGLVTPTLAVNKRYRIIGIIHGYCNNTGGIKYQITLPTGATVFGVLLGFTSGGGVLVTSNIVASATLSAAYCTISTTNGCVYFMCEIQMSSTTGVAQFGFASTTSTQTSTIAQLGTQLSLEQID